MVYDLLIEEQTSAWTSRAEVRAKVDQRLTDVGDRLAGRMHGDSAAFDPYDPDAVEAKRNHPSNEQGAKHLMAVAAGGR